MEVSFVMLLYLQNTLSSFPEGLSNWCDAFWFKLFNLYLIFNLIFQLKRNCPNLLHILYISQFNVRKIAITNLLFSLAKNDTFVVHEWNVQTVSTSIEALYFGIHNQLLDLCVEKIIYVSILNTEHTNAPPMW